MIFATNVVMEKKKTKKPITLYNTHITTYNKNNKNLPGIVLLFCNSFMIVLIRNIVSIYIGMANQVRRSFKILRFKAFFLFYNTIPLF